MVDITNSLKAGDRFKFEKIVVSARKIQKPRTTSGSGRHRTMQTICERDGLIFVDKTWKSKGGKNND